MLSHFYFDVLNILFAKCFKYYTSTHRLTVRKYILRIFTVCIKCVYITFIYSTVVISNMVIPFDLPKGGAVRTPVRCIELFNTGHQKLIKAEK